MKDNISPEDRLLNLIKGQKQPLADNPARQISAPAVSSGAHKDDLGLNARQSLKGTLDFFNAKRTVYLLLTLSLVYFMYSLAYPYLFKDAIEKASAGPAASSKKSAVSENKPFSFYMEGMKDRQVFNVAFSQESGQEEAVIDTDLASILNLVGIMAGDNPQAVIEDKTAGKTFYLSRGQSFGEFKVEEILEGKVILSSRGKRYELSL